MSFEKREAVVYFEQGKTDVNAMIDAVAKAGFRAVEKPGP